MHFLSCLRNYDYLVFLEYSRVKLKRPFFSTCFLISASIGLSVFSAVLKSGLIMLNLYFGAPIYVIFTLPLLFLIAVDKSF